MTMPTNAAWVAAWQALSVTGVTTRKTPPTSLGTSDLPALWPELPAVARNTLLVTCLAENKQRRMILHLAIEPLGQNTQAGNYTNAIALLDHLETALDAWTLTNFLDYDIALSADIQIGAVFYWGYRVEVTGMNVR